MYWHICICIDSDTYISMHVHIYIYNHSIPFGLILHMYPDRNRKNKSMAATGNNRHHVIALGSLPRV